MDPFSSNLNSEQSGNINYMDTDKYKAALKGNIDEFRNYTEPVHHLVTRRKNTILHICLSTPTVSTAFVNHILEKFPLLLKQANIKGETPLHIAARYGYESLVEVLIERANNPREDPESGVGVAREMLRMTNEEKATALHEAVRYNHLGVVKMLIAKDPDFPYSANDCGETPLYIAAVRGYSESVVEILENCTSIAYGGPFGKTALHAAVILGDAGMTRKILEKIPSLTKEADQKGWTPLHYASDLDHQSIVELLLEFDKSAAYVADKDGKIALHIAVSRRFSRSMLVLLENCPDCCELVDDRGWNVVHTAIKNNCRATETLLQHVSTRSLLNERDIEGNTPFHQLAASSPFVPIRSLPGADIMAVNKQNLTAIDILSANNDMHSWYKVDILEWLKKVGERPTGLNVVRIKRLRGPEAVNKFKVRLEKARDSHLVVAALIATVTFAAGFTIPGNFKTDKGQDQGTAILIRNSAFKAFVITNSMAMVSSISAVCIHFIMAFGNFWNQFVLVFMCSMFLTVFAMGAMVVAFVTGTYAVLAPSPGLAIVTCVIGLSFFLIFFQVTGGWCLRRALEIFRFFRRCV